MKDDINKTNKHLPLKIFIGTIVTVSLLYILILVGKILLVFPNVESSMTQIEGYFLLSVVSFVIGVQYLIKLFKNESSEPTEEEQ